MTVLDVVRKSSTVIGVAVPTVLFSGTDRTSLQMQNCVNEAASMVAFDAGHDWTKLKALATITGDGSTIAFNLPSDYARMLKKARLWPSAMPNAPLVHYPDTDTWLGMAIQNWGDVVGRWTLIGTQINIKPVVPAASTVQYYYLRNTYATDMGGTPKVGFDTDTDTFSLGERLLRLAFIYRWKQDRGQDYGQAMEDYQTSLATHIGQDKGSNILIVGRQRIPADVEIAYPGVVVP
jgi:hypothetical protein